MPKKINSRQKGARGERELSKYLTDHGFPARRGQQYSGSPDSPDIVCEALSKYHIECKRAERGNLYEWIQQATTDAGGTQVPLVIHKRNGRDWLCIMRLEDFLGLVK